MGVWGLVWGQTPTTYKGVYETGAQALAACEADYQGGGVACQSSGGGSGDCNSVTVYGTYKSILCQVWRTAGDTMRYSFVNANGQGCPGGQSFNADGKCAAGASQGQKDAASAAASGAASGAGWNSTAQAAAGAAAAAGMDAWIGAGKTVSQSQAAAASAGYAAGAQSAASQAGTSVQAAITGAGDCITAGGSPSACYAKAESGAHAAWLAQGLDPVNPPTMTMTKADGSKVIYVLETSGSVSQWAVYDGDYTHYLGSTASLSSPSPTGAEPVYGAVAPNTIAANTAVGTGTRVPSVVPPATASALTKYAGDGSRTTTVYSDSTPGAVLCSILYMPDGSVVKTGLGCSGVDANAYASLGGGSAGAGSAGGPSTITGQVRIDETGTPGTSGSEATLSGANSALDSAATERTNQITGTGGGAKVTEWPISFSIGFPEGDCTDPVFAIPGTGKSLSPSLCGPMGDVRAAMGWLFSLLAGLYLWRSATGAV